MKNYFYFLLTLFISLGFIACEPLEPTNEVLNKLHDDPLAATLSLSLGTYNSDSLFVEATPKQIQTIYFELDTLGWHPNATKGDTIFKVDTTGRGGNKVYYLTIRYHDVYGDITNQFIENGQNTVHQHFFSIKAESVVNQKGEKSKKVVVPNYFDYHYLDTTPWDEEPLTQGAKLTGKTDPLGFKGAFQFKTPHVSYLMNIELMHAYESKYIQPSKYFKPHSIYLSGKAGWDVKMLVPIEVK